jgi:AraC-like DNA-binding protein
VKRERGTPRRRAETPMAFVRAIVLAYEKYGLSADEALAKARISPAQLRQKDARIDAEQMETISATAMQELDDEALGWFSRRLPWGTYGLLCRASRGAPNLRVALKRWCRHHALLTDDIVLKLEEEQGGARLAIDERRELGPMREFCLLTSLRYVHGYACWLVDSQLPLVEVTFPFAPPPHASAYRFLFPGPVHFEREKASMVFDPRYLALRPKRDEPALDRMLEHALPLTVRQYRRDRLLVERVRGLLSDPGRASATAEAVASALHVSVRSLHRQLANEGASLQALKDDVRRQRAVELLRRTDIPIKQLVRSIGFTNDKSFARAFKAWTGQSPSAFRASGPG